MIPHRTWRAAVVAAVAGADLVVLLVAGTSLPGFLPFLLPVLAVATLWAVARPSGWGPFALVVVQVLGVGATGSPLDTVAGWALAAAAGAAVVVTHLALTLLGSWPRRADLPHGTARRWSLQAAALVWVAVAAAGAGALAAATPQGWAPWLGAVALALVAGLLWQLRARTRPGTG
ncbi:hypothetical protein GCM10023168_24610 [Fodinibacter luteus]|uniref:Integral membrane protein n=1 Tax=Fodinibacter luteus TaxID=552064 RepID=A0ABP8KJ21_9MICO